MGKIVVLGSTNTDMVISGRKLPAPGETVSGGEFQMNPGGKGANQAVAVARLAPKRNTCVFIGKVGDDIFGRDTATRMRRDGIDAKLVLDVDEPSGTALIFVDAKGQNEISVALGANATLSVRDITPFKSVIEAASALVLQLETPLATVLAAAKWAHAKGVKVILNPAPAPKEKLTKELLSKVDWLIPNETEASFLSGVKVVDPASAAKAAAALKKLGAKNVIITLGAAGCYCTADEKLYPAQHVRAVDCVAAGDTFVGAFSVGLLEGLGIPAAISFAQSACAIAVTRRGAQPSIPFRREIR